MTVLTNYPDNQLVSEIRKYVLLQLDAPDDFEPITEQELEEVENFDPNEEIFSDSDEEEEEEEPSDEEEEVPIKVAPPPPKAQPPPKPKVGKLPPPKQRKPVKKIVKPSVRVAVHNVHNVPVSKKK
ncbi:hypothetical protein M9Y10_012509 [Tritrichomonas musculus]|uniref:Uncharacterized protein n=1 Tax=Tritrichomonas musculus TaxID=1915356 RepID=A0ABR2IDT4_9EUKA